MIKKLKDIDLIMMRGNKRDLTCLFGTNMKIKDVGTMILTTTMMTMMTMMMMMMPAIMTKSIT